MSDKLSLFHRTLNQWYRAHGRQHLPWRNTSDPYAIYLSEVMLQQTQVKTVLERFYFPFLERFPTLQSLAKATQDEVLQMWQGLGYYSRARNLHQTAKLCPNGLPESVDALVALPGIGRNTAHAVAAFAFKQPVAVMEANVKRVCARIFSMEHPKEPELWQRAGELLDARHPFDYNQAMMDIGSMVCLKRAPLCHQCPAQSICTGQSSPEKYPATKASKEVKVRKKRIVVLVNDRGEYYATVRSSRFLHGLYHFIEMEEHANAAPLGKDIYLIEQNGFIGAIRQQYSHFTLEADIYRVLAGKKRGIHWHTARQLAILPMSMAEQKILSLLEISPKIAATS